MVYTYKHGIYELPHELPNDLRLTINIRKVSKPHKMIAYAPSPRQNENLANTSKKAQKNSNKTLPAVHYFTRKLELASDILWPAPYWNLMLQFWACQDWKNHRNYALALHELTMGCDADHFVMFYFWVINGNFKFGFTAVPTFFIILVLLISFRKLLNDKNPYFLAFYICNLSESNMWFWIRKVSLSQSVVLTMKNVNSE